MDEPGTAPAERTYATRKSVLEPETIWRLTPGALVRERIGEPPRSVWRTIVEVGYRVLFPWGGPLTSDGWPDRVPYEDISSLRVRFDPTRFDRSRERCDLVGPGGARVSLFSTRYVSFGSFEDTSDGYKPFINELTQRVLAARPETAVYSGLTWTSYIIQHGVLLLALLALASVLAMAGLPALGTVWAKIIITLSYVGTMWAYTRRNLPRKLNPPRR
ncbi:MAG: hypothetical protein ACK4MV_16085 [Beijerinckiaceae bacterium]